MAVQSSTTIYAIPSVQAGDLITAAYFNKLIAAVADLDARVRALEARPTPVPSSPPAPAPLAITSGALTTIGNTMAINVVGSGLEPAGLNSYRINTIPFTPLGSVLGDDDEIIIAIPPNPPAQVLTAIQQSGRIPFTLTLGSKKGETASVQVGGLRFVLDAIDFRPDLLAAGAVSTGTAGATATGAGAITGMSATGATLGPNFANLAGNFLANAPESDAPQ